MNIRLKKLIDKKHAKIKQIFIFKALLKAQRSSHIFW